MSETGTTQSEIWADPRPEYPDPSHRYHSTPECVDAKCRVEQMTKRKASLMGLKPCPECDAPEVQDGQ